MNAVPFNAAPYAVSPMRVASDIMTANPLSIDHNATLREAAAFFTAKGISAAPVIDEAGRPLGVLSRTDLVRHASEEAEWSGYQGKRARDAMTPAVFAVRQHAPLRGVFEQFLACDVHRLFVIDDNGVLIGVISALDLLRALEAEMACQSPYM